MQIIITLDQEVDNVIPTQVQVKPSEWGWPGLELLKLLGI